MLVQASFKFHPEEELLEDYSFGRVPEPALAPLEEHLLACSQCTEKVEEIDVWRAATGSFQPGHRIPFPRWLTGPLSLPKPAAAVLACGLLLAVAGAVTFRSYRPAAAASIRLTALRGGDENGVAGGPADRPLDLTMNAVTLPASPGYRVEMVNVAGQTVWAGDAIPQRESLQAHVSSNPGPGLYWVRLYGQQKLLREFGLRLR